MTPGHLLLIAAVAMFFGLLGGRGAPRLWLTAMLVGGIAALLAAIQVFVSGAQWDWRSEFSVCGEPLHLRLDAMSAVFIALLGALGGAGSVYSCEYWSDKAHPRSARAGRMWWSAQLLSLGLVLLSSNGLHFLIAWELYAVSSYFLITLDRQKREVRAAGWLYLAASHVAGLFLFAFFAMLAGRTGGWDLVAPRTPVPASRAFFLRLLRHACGAHGRLGPGSDARPCGTGSAVLAGPVWLRHKGRHVSTARMAAIGARQRAEPRLGHHVRRFHPGGNL